MKGLYSTILIIATVFLSISSFSQSAMTVCASGSCDELFINDCSVTLGLSWDFGQSYSSGNYRFVVKEGMFTKYDYEDVVYQPITGYQVPSLEYVPGYYTCQLFQWNGSGYDLVETGTFIIHGEAPNQDHNDGLIHVGQVQSNGSSHTDNLVFSNDGISGLGEDLIYSESSSWYVADFITADIIGDAGEEYILATSGSAGARIYWKEEIDDPWINLYGPNPSFDITCLAAGQLDSDSKEELMIGFRRVSDNAGAAYYYPDIATNPTLTNFYAANPSFEVTSIEAGDFDENGIDEVYIAFNRQVSYFGQIYYTETSIYKMANINSSMQLEYGPNSSWRIRTLYAGDPDDNGDLDLYVGFNKPNNTGSVIHRTDGDLDTWQTVYPSNNNWFVTDITGGKVGYSSNESIFYSLNAANNITRGTVLRSEDGLTIGSNISCPYAGVYMKEVWLRERDTSVKPERKRMSVDNQSSVNLFPNPIKAGSEANFSIGADFKLSQIDIYASSGEKVKSISLTESAQKDIKSIDTASLSAGIYLVSFIGYNEIKTSRLIVQ